MIYLYIWPFCLFSYYPHPSASRTKKIKIITTHTECTNFYLLHTCTQFALQNIYNMVLYESHHTIYFGCWQRCSHIYSSWRPGLVGIVARANIYLYSIHITIREVERASTTTKATALYKTRSSIDGVHTRCRSKTCCARRICLVCTTTTCMYDHPSSVDKYLTHLKLIRVL